MSLSLSKIRTLQTSAQLQEALDLIDGEAGRKLQPTAERDLLRAILAAFLGKAKEGELAEAVAVTGSSPAWQSDRGLALMLLGRMDDAKAALCDYLWASGDAVHLDRRGGRGRTAVSGGDQPGARAGRMVEQHGRGESPPGQI